VARGGRILTSPRGQLALGAGSIAGGLALGRGGGGNGAAGGASAETVYTWNTKTAIFHRLENGKIGTFKKDGVWKEWRPYKPVVIPKRWNARSMSRVKTALKRQQKTAMEIVRMAGGEASASKRAKTKWVGKGSKDGDIINVK
jgi:hypothetical protein